MELVADVLPPGVINLVNGGGVQLGRAVVEHGLIDEGYLEQAVQRVERIKVGDPLDILAGRVWINTHHHHPAGAGYGREAGPADAANYQEVNKVLFNHDPKPLGFFV